MSVDDAKFVASTLFDVLSNV
jgi:hypothetical protein